MSNKDERENAGRNGVNDTTEKAQERVEEVCVSIAPPAGHMSAYSF